MAAVALPLLLLAMSGLSRAATIRVNTLADASLPRQCSLRDAVTAANTQMAVNGCIAGTNNNDAIVFASGLTGTITLGSTLPAITDTDLAIVGPTGSGPTGSPGITISGSGKVQLFIVPSGPGVYLGSLALGPATLDLQLLTLANGSGGAIANGGTLIVSNCTFSNNQGSAIENLGAVTVTDSTFSQNQHIVTVAGAPEGVGGAISTYGSYPVTVTNCTFWDNTAASGATLYSSAGPVTITDCTFADNHATALNAFRGTVCSQFTAAPIEGSIFAGNTGTNCGCGDTGFGPYGVAYGLANEGYNISDDDTCGFRHSTGANGQTLGDNVHPLLAAGLANNGGPTETIALVTSPPTHYVPNPAIAAVPLADCTVRTDQRGYSRPGSGYTACSIGAYEFDAEPTPSPTPLPLPWGCCVPGDFGCPDCALERLGDVPFRP